MKKDQFAYWILFCIIIFSVSMLYTLFILPGTGDEIWNYGFSYNIAHGLMIYRDFNVLQMPFYFMVGSLFIRMFGDYLISMHIFDCLILTFLMMMVYRRLGIYKSMVLYPVILFNFFPTYSYFCLFLLFIILYLLDKKKVKSDVALAFLSGLILITKQSIGACMLVPILFYSKNRLKSLFIYFIPLWVICMYLLFHHAFFDFVNYCFLGMIDFQKSNLEFSIFFLLELISCFYLVKRMILEKFKDEKLFFILAFQINAYPIFDAQHFVIAFIPVFYYFLSRVNFSSFRIYYRCLLLFVLYVILGSYAFKIVFLFPYGISFDRDTFWFLRNNSGTEHVVLAESKIILEYLSNYDESFFIMGNAYVMKLYNHLKIGKYDMLLNGNLGYHGDSRVIQEIDDICQKESCVFFIEKQEFKKYSQFSRKIYSYVLENYYFVSGNEIFFVYEN